MNECIIIIYANNKHGVNNELDVVDQNCVEKYIQPVTECFYQSYLIIVKPFHFENMFNKIESPFKSFIHEHAVGGRHVCCLHKL